MSTAPLRVVSLGAGVQSTALLIACVLELKGCERPDAIVFADTQDEPHWVYDYLTRLDTWIAPHGLTITRVTAGRLSRETYGHAAGTRKRRAALPVFTEGKDGQTAILPRQCTAEYKLAPIQRFVRTRLGYEPRQRIPAGSVEMLIGLSFDELHRMKPSRLRWITNRWPLIDAAMTRSACLDLIEAHGLPLPKKSACIYCPFHDDAYWLDLQASEPESFAEACRFDDAVRAVSTAGSTRPVYIHRSLIPLRDVTFQANHPRLDGFGNECEGMCGV